MGKSMCIYLDIFSLLTFFQSFPKALSSILLPGLSVEKNGKIHTILSPQ